MMLRRYYGKKVEEQPKQEQPKEVKEPVKKAKTAPKKGE